MRRACGDAGGGHAGTRAVPGCAIVLGSVEDGRDVAQFGSALDWGSRGRRFKSGRPDQRRPVVRLGISPGQRPASLFAPRGAHGTCLGVLGTTWGPPPVTQ